MKCRWASIIIKDTIKLIQPVYQNQCNNKFAIHNIVTIKSVPHITRQSWDTVKVLSSTFLYFQPVTGVKIFFGGFAISRQTTRMKLSWNWKFCTAIIILIAYSYSAVATSLADDKNGDNLVHKTSK